MTINILFTLIILQFIGQQYTINTILSKNQNLKTISQTVDYQISETFEKKHTYCIRVVRS